MSVYNYTTLDVPSATGGTSVYGINAAGLIVGAYAITSGTPPSSQTYGFLYNPQNGTFTTLDDPSASHGGISGGTGATGINDLGQIVGSYFGVYNGVGGTHGFLYSGGTYTTLDVGGAGPLGTFAQSINNAGQIAGTYYDAGNVNHGFLYSGGIYTTLDVPGAGQTSAYGINNAGQIVGSYYTSGSGSHGFLYSGGTYTTLDDPAGTDTVATGINDLGQIVGYYTVGSGASRVIHAFLYTAGIYTALDDPTSTARPMRTASTTAMWL